MDGGCVVWRRAGQPSAERVGWWKKRLADAGLGAEVDGISTALVRSGQFGRMG